MQAREHSGFQLIECAAWIGAVGLIAYPVFRKFASRWRVHHPQAAKEPAIDTSLNNTYPASDPPSSRYFDIPVNRR